MIASIIRPLQGLKASFPIYPAKGGAGHIPVRIGLNRIFDRNL